MIKTLSGLGKAFLAWGAIALIVAGGCATMPFTMYSEPSFRAFAFVMGMVGGLLAAGLILGPLATLYDIADSLRSLVKAQKAAHP